MSRYSAFPQSLIQGLLIVLMTLASQSVQAVSQVGFWGKLTWDTVVAGEGDTRFRYGNWFGPGWWGGSELDDRVGLMPPVDALDAVAQKHDFGYQLAEELGKSNPRLEAHYKAIADAIAVRDALALPKDPRHWKPPARDPELAKRYVERIALGFPNYQQRLNELKATFGRGADVGDPDALDALLSKPLNERELEKRMNDKVKAWNADHLKRMAATKARNNRPEVSREAPPDDRKTSSGMKCTCEDWNRDGKYGVVLGKDVLRANYGTYSDCMSYAKSLTSCQGEERKADAKPELKEKNHCTCEDWNRDGKYGVVLGKEVLWANYGTYSDCMRYAKTLSKCQ